ncbi:tRNA (N6-threonylcarbamoyladenosine(37)-N6)-methyltransferase TrmO [bacterium]|nr:tRNA (N6-threonylcarbamoyladenosine(37)-N6)-methyltransferase TrmO [bacterium]
MNQEEIKYRPIGIIHTPFRDLRGVPIQPAFDQRNQGTIELKKEYLDGLKDLDGFSHILIIYHFHLSKGYRLHVVPFLDTVLRGLFATRAPKRPNPIGISLVKLIKIEGSIVHIEDIDVVDGTPLLDIKPYIRQFDEVEDYRSGWLSGKIGRGNQVKSDDRFK